MISQRLRGLSEDGEAVDGLLPKLEKQFASVGISIEDQNGELRSTFDILNDLAGVWDQLSSKQKQYFGEKIAGNRQVKTLNAIMQNWDVVADTIDKANNSQGAAIEGNEMYMESVAGKITELKSAWQELATTTISGDFVKGFVELGTSVVKLATNMGGLVPVLTTVLGLFIAIKGAKIGEVFAAIGTSITNLVRGVGSATALMSGWVGIAIAAAGAIYGIVTAINNASVSLKDLEAASDEAKNNYSEQQTTLQSLNDELATTQERIKELEGKTLSIVEEDELSTLREQNIELQRRIDLQKELTRIAEREAREAAVNTIKEYNGDNKKFVQTLNTVSEGVYESLGEELLREIINPTHINEPFLNDNVARRNEGFAATNRELADLYMKALPKQIQERDNRQKAYSIYTKSLEQEGEFTKEAQEAAKESADLWAGYAKESEDWLTNYYNYLTEQTEGISYVENAQAGSIDAQYNEMLALRDQVGEALMTNFVAGQDKQGQFDYIINLDKFKDQVKEISEEVKNTGTIDLEEMQVKFPDLIEEFKKYGWTPEKIQGYLVETFSSDNMTIEEPFSIGLDDITLFSTTESYKNLTKAMTEQQKAGVLSLETLQALLSDDGLKGINKHLIQTADGYMLNTDTIYDFIKAEQDESKLDIIAAIMERQTRLKNLQEQMAALGKTEEDLAKKAIFEEEQKGIEAEIIQLQATALAADNATSSLERFQEALKTANQDAAQDEGENVYKTVKERYEEGKIGTDEFKKGMDFLLGDNWQEDFEGDIDEAYKEADRIGKRYFGENDTESADNFRKDLVSNGLATYDEASGELTLVQNDLATIADTLGISEEAAESLFGLLNSYSPDKQFSFDKPITSAEELAKAEEKLAEKQERQAELEKEIKEAEESGADTTQIEEMQEEYNKTTEEVNALSSAIETAKKTIDENGTIDTSSMGMDEAIAEIERLQAAIDTLEINAVTPNVELGQELKQLIDFIEGGNGGSGSYQIQVNDIGDAQERISDIDEHLATLKSLEDSGAISVEVAAGIRGNYESQRDALNKYIEQAKKIKEDFPDGDLTATITADATDNASPQIEFVDKSLTDLNGKNANTTINTDAQDAKDDIAGIESDLNQLEKDSPTTITFEATDNGEIDDIDSKADKVLEKDRIIKYTVSWLVNGGEPSGPEWGDTPEYSNGGELSDDLPDWSGIPKGVRVIAELDGDLQGQTKEEIEEGASKSNPTTEVEVDQEKIEEDIDNAVPDEVETDVNPDVSEFAETITDAAPESVSVEVETKPSTLNPPEPPTSGSGNTNYMAAMSLDTSGATNELNAFESDASKTVTAELDADTSQADSKIDKTHKNAETQSTMPVNTNINRHNLDDVIKDIGIKRTMDVTVNYKEENKPTGLAVGTSNAKGGISLVDEEGAELIEHTSKGTFELGTNNGARFTKLEKGDVVHTAPETKKIMSRLSNIGGFFKNGLNQAKSIFGNAFAAGREKKVKGSSTLGALDRVLGSGKKRTSSSSSSRSSSSSDKDQKKFEEWAAKLFDWAEIRLDRLKTITTTFLIEATDAIGSIAKNKAIKSAMKSVDAEIKATKKAYEEYKKTAEEVAKQGKLSESIVKKIQDGTIKIEKYSPEMQKKIKQYQEWWNKALGCVDAVKELKEQEKELAAQRLKNIADEYDYKSDTYQTELDKAEAQRDLDYESGKAPTGTQTTTKKVKGKKVTTTTYGDYQTDVDALNASISNNRAERTKLTNELNKLMKSGEVKEGDDTWKEYTAKIASLGVDIRKDKADLARAKEAANNVAIDKLGYEIDAHESNIGNLSDKVDLGISRGSISMDETGESYKNIISEYKDENKILEEQNELYKQQQKGLDKTSAKYQKLEKKIQDNNSKMNQNNKSVQEYTDKINSITFDKLNYKLDELADDAAAQTDAINEKVQKGIRITSSSYQSLIDNANNQIKVLEDEKAAHQALNDAMVAQYGESAKASAAYKQNEAVIRDLDSQIRGLTQSTYEWEDAIKNIPVQELNWRIGNMKANIDAKSGDIALSQAKGEYVDEDSYRSVIDDTFKEASLLESQNKYYEEQMKGMSEFNETYQDYLQKIRDNKTEINNLRISIEEMYDAIDQLKIDEYEHQLDNLKASEEEYSDIIESRKARSLRITKEYYQNLIDNGNAQIKNYEKQKIEYFGLMFSLEYIYGESAKESDKYKEYEKTYNSLNDSIRDTTLEVMKYTKAIKDIPIQELTWQYDKLTASADRFNNAISLHEAQGIKETSKSYKELIDNGMKQIDILEQQNKEYRKLQIGTDILSDDYQEIEKNINSNIDAIEKLKVSQEQWNDSIIDLGIDEIEKYKEAVSKTNDEYKKQKELQEAIQDLEKATYQRRTRTYVEGEGFVYQSSADEIKNAQEKIEDLVTNQLLDKLDDLIQALEESKDSQNVYDANGNLIGTRYTVPNVGTINKVLSDYANNNVANLDIGVLSDSLGKSFASSVGNTTNNTPTLNIGDIFVNEANDGNELARAIVNQFPNALLQALYKK